MERIDSGYEEEEFSTIWDKIHGAIEVPQLCRAIINTVQFDRLRGLKQNGNTHHVFPRAKHTRWEHSVGVMYLAGQMMDHLLENWPGSASQADKLCLMIAGLCHDLGHGPFSHLWESLMIEAGFNWSHEKTSLDILEFLIVENSLLPVFEQHGLTEIDITFIKECICGGPLDSATQCVGRGAEKGFLYEIVNNKRNGIDVDKWDYMLRDDAALNIGVTLNPKRLIKNTSVCWSDGRSRLCYADTELDSLKDMFRQRAKLHRDGYQENNVKIIDRMMLDALLVADQSRGKEMLRLSEACGSLKVFCHLTDDYIESSLQNTPGAKNILQRIPNNLYKLIGEVEASAISKDELSNLSEDYQILKKKINMGMGEANPLHRVSFFNSFCEDVSFTDAELSRDFSVMSSETLLLICKREDSAPTEADKKIIKKFQS